jgi:hypothetical protein
MAGIKNYTENFHFLLFTPLNLPATQKKHHPLNIAENKLCLFL